MDRSILLRNISLKISYFKISKILFAFYIVYNQALYYTSYYIPRLSSIVLAGAMLLSIISTKRIIKDRYLLAYILFILYTFCTGLMLAVGRAPFMMSIRNLSEYFFSFYLIHFFSKEDRNIYFSVNVFILLAFVMSVLNLTMGQGVNRITFSEDLNVNTIAVVMMFAIGFILYCLIQQKNSIPILIISFALIILFSYMILITVSKKAILGTGFLIMVWVLWCSSKDTTGGKIKKIIIFTFVMSVLYYGYEFFVKYMPSQYNYLMLRMGQLYEGSSSDKRRELMTQGFTVFLQNPIFGVGLNNFRYYTYYNTYSHCFYAELFSCTGFLGASIFFIPFFTGIMKLIKKIKLTKDYAYKNRYKFIFVILACLMFTSIAQIIFYEFVLIYILGIVTASKYIIENDYER